MGKRKSARKPVAKAKVTLEKQFLCFYCNHEKAVTVKVDKREKIGHLSCKFCGVSWQTVCQPPMDEPVDVYHDWLDAADQINRPGAVLPEEEERRGPDRNGDGGGRGGGGAASRGGGGGRGGGGLSDDDDDGEDLFDERPRISASSSANRGQEKDIEDELFGEDSD
ncbi:hypothetical protein HDV00_003191 [Rhizophlyctis rosea]|nr:hypothetical protein HDV00_003191 [Rhizophlyctis rosea]